jgi:RNA polymerase sigma-70 factor (ECF subfamily)
MRRKRAIAGLADEELMTLVAEKRIDAFEVFYERHAGAAYSLAHRIVGDPKLAEDVTQEAFLRAFRFLKGFRGDSKFTSWLFRIARNCAMDAIKARRAHYEKEPAAPLASTDPQARVELQAALSAVGEEHREPFLLIEVFGLSYQEAADVLGVRVGTVKSRMHRARKAMMGALAIEEDAGGS